MKAALLLPLSFLLLPFQEPRTLTYNYKNGDSVNAQVLEVKGEDVKLKVFVLGGSMQVTRKLAEFTPDDLMQSGNGELVNLVITAGICGDVKCRVLDYIRLWHIGLGYLYWDM